MLILETKVMPTIAFGLGQKSKLGAPKPQVAGQKRKLNILGDDGDDEVKETPQDEDLSTVGGISKQVSASLSSKLGKVRSQNGEQSQRLTNLSSLHSAKRHAEQASTIDSSIYDYDAAYETFHAPKKETLGATKGAPAKYMTNLLKTAEVRKRDQLRAKDKLLQREREAEGDEFDDKEKFVTGAYKAQQEENRKLEEAEAIKEAAEEEKRKKGAGMTGFYKDLLKKDEERSVEISKAAIEAAANPKTGEEASEEVEEKSASAMAAELNASGRRVAINDEGEVVDKRQLLSAGLNVAPKPKSSAKEPASTGAQSKRESGYSRPAATQAARGAQRERQTQMMVDQLEKVAEQQAQAELDEQKALEAKAKSQKSSTEVSSARERYLARKKEQDAQKAK